MGIERRVNKRNINLDFIRAVACISLLCLHFYLNSGWYNEPLIGSRMFASTLVLTLFRICVPLFLMLTGYLVNKKELSLKYYSGLIFIISIYVLSSIACFFYSTVYLGNSYTLSEFIIGITGFKFAEYSWYINMYIGLFLFIPFLNIIWNHRDNKRYHQITVVTMLFVSTLPSIPFLTFLPNWWTWQIFPILYYFLGAYLNKYDIKIKNMYVFILLLVFMFVFGTYNFIRSNGMPYISDVQVDWAGYQTVIMSTIMFVLLSKLNLNKLFFIFKLAIYKIAECSLGIYLVSSIFDNYFYRILNTAVIDVRERIFYFPIVLLVFLSSLIISQLLVWIYKIICYILNFMLCYLHKRKGVINDEEG